MFCKKKVVIYNATNISHNNNSKTRSYFMGLLEISSITSSGFVLTSLCVTNIVNPFNQSLKYLKLN